MSVSEVVEEEEEQKQRDEGGEVVRQTMREAEGRRSIPAYCQLLHQHISLIKVTAELQR